MRGQTPGYGGAWGQRLSAQTHQLLLCALGDAGGELTGGATRISPGWPGSEAGDH